MSSVTIDNTAPSAGSQTVRVLRSYAEVEALREQWAAMPFGHPDADVDVFLSVLRSRPEVIRPHVLVLDGPDGPDAILAARVEDVRVPAKFGYATVVRPRLRLLTVVTGGAGGDPAGHALLATHLLAALTAREADAVSFQRVPTDAPLYGALRQIPRGLVRQRFVPEMPHWVLDLPSDPAQLLPSLPKSVRENLKRYSRRLEREQGEKLEIRRFDRPEQLDDLVRDLEHIAATTYQRGLGAGFDASTDRELAAFALDGGWLRAWALYLDGVPCAFEIGHLCGESLVISAKGFDPAFGRLHVGKVLQLRMLQDLCADPAVSTLDFGFGDADYKRKLATRGWQDTDVLIYGRTPRALAAAAARTGVIAADRGARRLAGKERISQIKRRWRDRRTPATP